MVQNCFQRYHWLIGLSPLLANTGYCCRESLNQVLPDTQSELDVRSLITFTTRWGIDDASNTRFKTEIKKKGTNIPGWEIHVTRVEDKEEGVSLERQCDLKAFDDKSWHRCWSAVNKNIFLFVFGVHAWILHFFKFFLHPPSPH
mgnify:CR=1 FL=1